MAGSEPADPGSNPGRAILFITTLIKLKLDLIFMKRSSKRWKKQGQMRWKWQRKRLKKEKRKRRLQRNK